MEMVSKKCRPARRGPGQFLKKSEKTFEINEVDIPQLGGGGAIC
jgi:hypothetical protein